MKNDGLIIALKKGINGVMFGTSVDDVVKQLGNPSEIEEIGEDIECPTTILHYDQMGLSLFFDSNYETKLVCIDVDDPEVTLFDNKLIGKNPKEIVDIMVKNEIYNETMEEEDWGEKRISFEDYSIDFYFIDEKLVSITFGK